MSSKLKYIRKVEISKLWGYIDIEWTLNSDVNILAGINGSGKSTILFAIHSIISNEQLREEYGLFESLTVFFQNGRKISIASDSRNVFLSEDLVASFKRKSTCKEIKSQLNINLINTFENNLIQAEAVKKLSNNEVKTDLDWQLYQLQKQYVDYQLNLSKKKDEIFENGGNHQEQFEKLRYPQKRFLTILDELFAETNKKVNRKTNEITFLLNEKTELKSYQLSSGEKQVLVILLTVLIQNNQPSILFMDEPEVSLHIEWQKKLIGFIRELNPNVQLIIATHSPAMIMNGWMDKVFNVEDITIKQPTTSVDAFI